MHILVKPVTPETPGFAALKEESLAQQLNMLRRLEANWLSGDNRFDRQGEKLLGAFSDGELIGIGGLNQEPYTPQPRLGRIRHLYVAQQWRRKQVGMVLLNALMDEAQQHFDLLNTFAPATAFDFYQRAGFNRVYEIDKVTHCRYLPMSE